MYSTHNEGKSVVAVRNIGALKNNCYKYMTSISTTVHIDKLDDIVNKYSDTYTTIKMKPIDVKSSRCIYFAVENNDKDPKFEVGDHVRISKYKNIFAKRCTPHQSEETFFIKKIQFCRQM